MLVKFFKTGGTPKGQIGRSGGGNSARDYLLFEKDENGNKVPRKGATLFRGDADMTTETINGLENRTVYSSGVISFSENENPSDELLNKLIDSYEKTLFPIFNKDQYSSYWVKHEDKGRVELHFIIANVELYSGKVLPVYYDKNDRGLVDSWQNYNNDLYGLDNPKAPQNKRSRKITKDFEVKDGYQTKDGKLSDEELKGQIYDRIFAYTKFMPNISNRDDVIKAFEQFDYKVVSKPTDKYISIEHPEQKNNPDKKLRNLRFKDDLCLLNFNRDMLKDMKSYKQQKWERDTPNRLAQSKIDLDRNLEYRIKRMEKKFKNIERKPLDNQLTKDLTQIRATNEPNFLKKVAEYQREELKKIIGQSIEQIYKQHEHDQPEQLTALKNLHQTLIDSIDNQIADEPLPQFDQIIEQYTNAKNHVVTVDTIEHDRRQAELSRQQAEIVVPTVRLSLAEQRARNRARKGQDELTPEQRVAKSFAEQRAKAQTAPPRQSTVVPQPTYAERMRISERMAELMQFDSLDPDRIPQSFIDDLSQHEPSRLDNMQNHYSNVIKKSYEIIQERDLTETEKDNHKTAVFFSRAIDRVKQLASAIKEKFTAKAEPEPVAEIVRSDESKPQPSDRAKLKVKLEEMQNKRLQETIERNRELERELERLNQREQPQTPPERELSEKAKIGLQTIKNVIDAMPDGDKKNKAMAEFERTKATATDEQLQALAQLDVKVNKAPSVDIKAPSDSQEQQR